MHPLKVNTLEDNPELFVLENGGENDRFMTASYNGRDVVGRLDWLFLLEAEVSVLLALAFDALDANTQLLLEKIEVAYAFCMQRRHMRYVDLEGYEPGPHSPRKPSDLQYPDFPDTAYPAVIRHPVTGRRILGIVEQFLDRVVSPHKAGLSNDEAIELLERLVAHTRRPEFHYFHEWRQGDMILWDNWRAMHCATGTPPGVHRVINRTTIAGDVALGRVLP